MYGVSNVYKEAMHQRVQRHIIYGTIGSVEFTDANILSGSMTILNQCSGTEEIAIGQVFVGELKATFRNINIPRGSWQGKEITVVFSLCLDEANDVWEDVPVGVYTVLSSMHNLSGTQVVAYDHMNKLDKTCGTRFTAASPYSILTFACTECGVQLGNTEEEIRALPNGTEFLVQYPESDIETWRDMVSWVAQTLGCFATAGRDGKIYLRKYGQTVVDTIDAAHRHDGAAFSDFQTRYTGMSVVNMANENTSYYALDPDDGLTYNLGSNPFLQPTGQKRDEMRRRVLDALGEINYTPLSTNMIGNVAYDLGDVIQYTGGSAANDLCCVTKFVYTHHGGYAVSGVGKNPATATGKSKSDKNIVGLTNRLGADTFAYDVIRNGRAVDVADGQNRRITRASIMCKENAKIKMDAEILLNTVLTAGKDKAVGTVTYILDGTELERHPIETWLAGNHILTLQYFLQLTDPGFHTFDIFLEMADGSIHINEFDVLEVFSGTGVAAEAEWNGIIEIEEDAPEFAITSIAFEGAYDEGITIRKLAPVRITASDTASEFVLNSITFDHDAVDNLILIKHLEQSVRVTEDGTDRATESGDVRYTEEEE